MKIRSKRALGTGVRVDASKLHRLKSSLQQVSFEQRTKELGAETKVRVNVKGNQRGMHAADDSEKMRQVRAMRKLWNKRLPVMHCNNCAFSQQCPQFKAGYECAFNRFFDSHEITSEQDLIFYAKELCGQAMKRSQKMLLAETLSGGAPSLETSEAISIAFAQLMQLYDRMTETTEVEIESTDNTIIGRLFGGLDGLMAETANAVADPVAIPSSSAEARLVDVNLIEAGTPPLPAARKQYDPMLLQELSNRSSSGGPTEESLA